MKKFRDLKKGDSIFHAVLGPKKWEIETIKVLDIKINSPHNTYITIALENNELSGIYPEDLSSNGYNHIWTDHEEAIRDILATAKNRRQSLYEKIDSLIMECDEIEKFIKKYES